MKDNCCSGGSRGEVKMIMREEMSVFFRLFAGLGFAVLGGWLLLVFSVAAILGVGVASAYDLATGARHTCAIDDNGLTCWGCNQYGQAMAPAGLTNPTAIAVGGGHTCAIDDSGVTCWGLNSFGESAPPADLINPKAIAAGHGHTCAVDDNGAICWGKNNFGQSTIPEDLIFVPEPTARLAILAGVALLGLLQRGRKSKGRR